MTETANTESIPQTKDPTAHKAELKKLFDDYFKKEEQLDKILKEQQNLASKMQAIVRDIAQFGSGPFTRGDRKLTVVKRTNKKTQEVVYYLRGPEKVEGLEV